MLAVGGGINTNALMSLLVLALGVAHIAMNRINIRRIPLATPYALFVGGCFLTLAITPDPVAGFEDWLRILVSLIVYIMVVDLMQYGARAAVASSCPCACCCPSTLLRHLPGRDW